MTGGSESRPLAFRLWPVKGVFSRVGSLIQQQLKQPCQLVGRVCLMSGVHNVLRFVFHTAESICWLRNCFHPQTTADQSTPSLRRDPPPTHTGWVMVTPQLQPEEFAGSMELRHPVPLWPLSRRAGDLQLHLGCPELPFLGQLRHYRAGKATFMQPSLNER